VGDSGIDFVPEIFNGADSSGFYVFEGTLNSGEDFGFGLFGFLLLGDLLKGLEDEGVEGEVLLGSELGELLFEVLGNLDGMHGLGSLVRGFAEFVEVGDAGFCPNAFFEVMFGDFSGSGFDRLEMAFGVEDLFSEGGEFVGGGTFDFGEFGVDDFEGLGGGGDCGVLVLEIGDEGFKVVDRGLNFGVSCVVIFDVGIDLLEDLDFLGVGEGVVVFA
jgi:hypothetical protein